MSGADAVVHILHRVGIRSVFGLASGKLSPLFKALSTRDDMRFIGVRHEASAAFMASGIAAATGQMALCLGETGPGGLNLLSALGGAWANHLPVLAITSSNPSAIMHPHRGAFSSTDNESLFRHLTKWNARVTVGERLPELIHCALREALSGRPGPVHLDIPAEILGGIFRFSRAELDAPMTSFIGRPPAPHAQDIAVVVDLLRQARRPLIVAGGGVARSGSDACAAMVRLLDRVGCPGIATQMGLGVIPQDHPQCLGQGGFVGGSAVVEAMQQADLVLAFGCRFSSFLWVDGPPRWDDRPDRKLVQIDIDPAALGHALPLTLGLTSDAGLAIEALVQALSGVELYPAPDWLPGLTAKRDAYRASIDLKDIDGLIHPGALAQGVARFIGPDDLVTLDGGHTSFWSNEFTPALVPSTRFHEPGMSHLGFGLPAALAMAGHYPDRRVFCLTGDGAFGFNLQELDTARRYGLKVITIIHNNASWGVIRAAQNKHGFEIGTDLDGTDYAAIARAFGCHGERLERLEDLDVVMARALAADTSVVIDARVGWSPHPMFPTFGASTAHRL
ncbi:acetolactate synthase-1/2/3 large subunit [Novosphingobium sediminicola]|uniref:Acetolactate synthase-1/2/3 large subunit n=2 Tax=Novosphingobium sediminicola TaxID=563162 RepID=A0A7W6CNE1_9SPHN|nr:acetolactate synthase-1/2/3 large subunit [Novosphingobium sediminicola]